MKNKKKTHFIHQTFNLYATAFRGHQSFLTGGYIFDLPAFVDICTCAIAFAIALSFCW